MYDLLDHRRMVADMARVGPYARALAAAVRPDDVVLDLGCGIGVMSVLAARAGARHVYAVDVDDCVQYARRVVAENGVGDRVTLFRGRIQAVDLPERPTLLVTDLRGAFPIDSHAIATWNAAVPRLASGARTIPIRDVVLAQPIRSASVHATFHDATPVEGVSFVSLLGALANAAGRAPANVEPLAAPERLFEIRYGAPLDGRFAGSAEFRADAPWEIDAFLVGFEAELAPGISLRSFGPGRAASFGIHALPAPRHLVVPRGACVRLHLATDPAGEGVHLRWKVDVDGQEGPWQGPLLEAGQSLDVLDAALPGHVPAPDVEDAMDLAILSAFAESLPLGRAVAAALARLPPGTARAEVEARAVAISCRRQARVVRRFGGG